VLAGFPSPAEDYAEGGLNVHSYLVRNPVATFFFPVRGDSMQGAQIVDGDILVLDRRITLVDGHAVVAFVQDERLVKSLRLQRGRMALGRAPGLPASTDRGRHGPRHLGHDGGQVQEAASVRG
jgi:DNA polymerase V